ncbi:MAG TPA: proton-conducting transporter membrane subunit [Anaerolineales bacterium]
MLAVWTLLAIGLPWLGALCLLVVGDCHRRRLNFLASLFAVLAGMATLAALPLASGKTLSLFSLGGVFGEFTLLADGLSLSIAAIATVVGSAAVIFAIDYMKHAEQLARFYALMLFFIGAMVGLAVSGSLLIAFLFWEITAFCSYALISFHNDDPRAVAGGIQALIMTQVGGVGLLVGALLVYAYFGNYQVSSLLQGSRSLPPGALGFIAFGFLVAAAAKSAQVPFHAWLPDAMEAPTPVTALIHAATMVNAGVYLLARFYPAFEEVPGWRLAVMAVGVLSALVAGLLALTAGDIKRVLAYSTISQLGYMVYAVGTGSIFAAQFHLFSHAIFKALLFLSAGAVITLLGTRDLVRMGGLRRLMPFIYMSFGIGSLGLAGLPIANGFFSKELVLEGGLEGGPFAFYLLMLLGAGITALYTIRLFWMVFHGERRGPEPSHDGLPFMSISLGILSIATLTTWLAAGNLSRLLANTLPYHRLEPESTWTIVRQVTLAPATWIALAVIALGFGAWFIRARIAPWVRSLKPLAAHGFGLESLPPRIATWTDRLAASLQVTQTGQLNWNVAGIPLGVILVLLILIRYR